MNAETLKEAIPYMFKAGIVPFIWGRHGIGKSQIIKQVAKDLGDWHVFDCRLNTQSDVGDIIGLQDFKRGGDGKITSTTHFMPQWLKECIDFCNDNEDKGAIVFFDELNRAARYDMVGPIFQMSIDKRLHIWKFPKNLHIIVASNPNTEDYQTINLDDKALLDRFGHIKFTPAKEEFFNYARKNNADESILAFLSEHPQFLESETEDFSINEFAKPSRRTWLDQVQKLNTEQVPKKLLREIMLGLVGTEITISYMKFLENDDKPLTVSEVLDKYSNFKTEKPTKYQLKVEKFKNAKTGQRIDLFNYTIDALTEHLSKLDKPITEKQGKNLINFIIDMPKDTIVRFLAAGFTFKSCSKFLTTTDFRKKELKDIVVETRNLTED